MNSVKDPNTALRRLAIDAILNNHKKISTPLLASEFVPCLTQELTRADLVNDSWPLARYSLLIDFLLSRDLLLPSHLESLHKQFDVRLNEEQFRMHSVPLTPLFARLRVCSYLRRRS